MSSKIALIIQREYNQRVRKKSFIITTLLMPLIFAAMTVLPVLLTMGSKSERPRNIAVSDQSGLVATSLNNDASIEFTVVDTDPEELRRNLPEMYDGVLIIGADIIDSPENMQLYTRQSSTIPMENAITWQVSSIIEKERISRTGIASLAEIINYVKARAKVKTYTITAASSSVDGQQHQQQKSSSSVLAMGIGYLGGFMIYMFIFIYGNFVMQGVIEEKSNRIMEVMVSSVRPFELMMGKILGVALVAMTQLFIWIIVGVGLSMFIGEVGSSAISGTGAEGAISSMMSIMSDPGYIISIACYYLLFFVGGYLLYSAMFAAVGSAVDNIQDAAQLQLPVTMPLIISIVIMMSVVRAPDSSIAFWFSIIPFTSPIVMMARIPYGIPLWEIALSLGLLYTSFVAMTWVSAKIYRTGIFMYGKKPTLREIIKWIRYKG